MKKKESNIKPVLLSVCFFTAFSLFYISGKYLLSRSKMPADYAGPSENLFNLKIPKDLQFAGEPIPTDDYSIKENMERIFNGGNFEKSTAYILFNRAAQWFPLIEKILKRNNIPEDFKYIALAESRLTNCISPQGAVGFWQFIASTAQNYGLEVNSEVDERYHVEKSTEAACKFIKEAYRKFGNWTLCAAAYNMGMGGIEAHIKKQPSKSYYDLMMNKETSFYIYRILALKTVFLNSGKKFHGGGKNIYNVPSVLLKVDTAISNLSVFAEDQKYDNDILKTYNPWLIANTLSNPERKTYIIRFPKKEYLKKIAVSIKPDSVFLPKEIKPDSIILETDTNVQLKKDTDKNEQPQ
ncbi:MAG TPA: lytic transglycosylase domain-containing protein [Bacteroidia bacterium]|jgi:membrane-bound lytic murein transglycosylase D|nr:lytic transglycosylase domain-containing protein [Bacteroidia bacterium]